MEEKPVLSLDEKIQKLINNYTELKTKYADLVVQKAEMEKTNSELSEFKSLNNGKLEELQESFNKQQEEIEFLRNENRNLRSQTEKYENKMKEASSKIDSIFGQLSDL